MKLGCIFTITQLNRSFVHDVEHFISDGNNFMALYIYVYIYIYIYIYMIYIYIYMIYIYIYDILIYIFITMKFIVANIM